MDYHRKIKISNFYTLPFQCILVYKLNRNNNLLTELKLGPRRVLKLEMVNIDTMDFVIWYKKKNGEVLFDVINIKPIKKEDKYELDVKKAFKDIIEEPLNLNGFTITNYKKYPDRYRFETFKNGLVIKQITWLDCNYYTTCFYLKNNTIKEITNEDILHITYESVFGDMDEFYDIMEQIANETYKGSIYDLVDTFSSITEFVSIGETFLIFDEYNKDIIKIKKFNLETKIKASNKYLKDILKKIIESKNDIDLTNNINKLKICGYL